MPAHRLTIHRGRICLLPDGSRLWRNSCRSSTGRHPTVGHQIGAVYWMLRRTAATW